MIENLRYKLQAYWNNLNDREKRIMAAMGVVLALFVLMMPVLVMTSSNASLEEENNRLQMLLDDIATQRGRLLRAAKEKRQAKARYRLKTPPLGGFLENLAGEQGLTIRELSDQPEKTFGKYTRRSVRITIPRVGLSPIIHLMSAVESSRYPVAIERIELDHFTDGDQYTLKLGVVTFDRVGALAAESGSDEGEEAEEEEADEEEDDDTEPPESA